jgi:hypothetical protein
MANPKSEFISREFVHSPTEYFTMFDVEQEVVCMIGSGVWPSVPSIREEECRRFSEKMHYSSISTIFPHPSMVPT